MPSETGYLKSCVFVKNAQACSDLHKQDKTVVLGFIFSYNNKHGHSAGGEICNNGDYC